MSIHFVGIGGIGVSALARYFLARGNEVSGSDAAESEIVEDLRKMGVKITSPQPSPSKGEGEIHLFEPEALRAEWPNPLFIKKGTDLVIYSAAVQESNPELIEARRLGIKTQKYAEALGELTKKMYTIAISGMHGKSTTTAMIGLMMEKAGLDPTVIVGTKVRWNAENYTPPNPPLKGGQRAKSPLTPLFQSGEKNYSNCRVGKSKYLVIEADEYDRSFLNYWPKILVLLNIEEEHLDTYTGGLADILKTFEEYVSHLSEDGVLVANGEDENIVTLINPKSEFLISKQIINPKFQIQKYNSNAIAGLSLKIPGRHNISNANAALAVARVLGIDEKIAVGALNDFSGAWRRMEYKGLVNGAKIYDDYGHHPTEIKATLAGARELLNNSSKNTKIISPQPSPSKRGGKIPPNPPFPKWGGKLWCVFQPHQYQRTYNLFEQFVGAFGAADRVILLPIYSVAGREDEEIKKKVSSEKLVLRLQAQGKPENIIYLDNFDEAAGYLRKNLQPGDVCIVMGAGDIYKLTKKLS